MRVERLGYRPWRGALRPSILSWLPIARSGLRSIYRRRLFRIFLFLGLINFILHFALIYIKAQFESQIGQRGGRVPPPIAEALFTGNGESYRNFISFQGTVVMLLLGFGGAQLVGNDFRHRAIAFYLSKPITKLDYFLGKLGATSGLAALVTLVPALVLYIEYGAFTESIEYYFESQRILWSIVGYGLLVSLSSAVLILGVAALLQRTIPIIVAWAGIFIFLPAVANLLRAVTREQGQEMWMWGLLDFWSLLRWTSNCFFGIREDFERLPYTLGALAAWLALGLWLFWTRVRAVEIVR